MRLFPLSSLAVIGMLLSLSYDLSSRLLPSLLLVRLSFFAHGYGRGRLPKPRSFLEDLPALVNPGGVAVTISPYSWLEEYTPSSVRTRNERTEGSVLCI